MKIDYTFHSHTFRCGHASGDIADYVSLAVGRGFKIYGVSDHVFLPGIHEPWIRGDYSLLDEYIEDFNNVKNRYKNDIEMYLGFECEYCVRFDSYYRSLLKEKGFDYLICGQHFNYDSGKIYGYGFDTATTKEPYKLYIIDLIKAMKSGLFLYIAHPDLFFLGATEVNDKFKEMTKEIIDAAIKYDAVLEINISGYARNHNRYDKCFIDYPCEYFWKEVAKTNIKVVYGGDYHRPEDIVNEDRYQKFEELIKKTNIKFVDIKDIYMEYKKRLKKLL